MTDMRNRAARAMADELAAYERSMECINRVSERLFGRAEKKLVKLLDAACDWRETYGYLNRDAWGAISDAINDLERACRAFGIELERTVARGEADNA